MKNCNFPILTKKDKYFNKYKKQRKKRGFGDDELWNLDNTFSSYIIPRLKRFIKSVYGYPGELNSIKKWKQEIKKMIIAHELLINRNRCSKKEEILVKEGLDSFHKYYRMLWN